MSEAHDRTTIVFMGTPEFAATVLQKLAGWEQGRVVAAYCQPDRPAGRGHKLVAAPVKNLAQELGIPVYQPHNFKDDADRRALYELQPDVLVVAAYGLILPQPVLDIPRLGPLNVHGSLLPRYRGAAPIQRAIMDGEAETGVAIMRMEAGLDTGPVYAMRSLPIGEHTAGSLHDTLAELGGELLLEVLEALRQGMVQAVPQEDALATYAAKMTKIEGCIDWCMPAEKVHAQIRGVTPWPGAQALFELPEKGIFRVTLGPGVIGPEKSLSAPCGGLWLSDDGKLGVITADRIYMLDSVRPADRKPMPASAFVNGYLPRGSHGLCGRAQTLTAA